MYLGEELLKSYHEDLHALAARGDYHGGVEKRQQIQKLTKFLEVLHRSLCIAQV